MKLEFEIIEEIGVGNYPDLLHMYDNEAQAIYLKSGEMYGKTTLTPYGEWANRKFEDEVKILDLPNLSHFEINKLGGFGAIGVVKSGDSHKLLIYEFQHDVSEYLHSGSIKHSIDNPISRFTLALENAKNPNADDNSNIAVSENSSLISPGAKVIFKFGMGEELEEYELGQFYVDRSDFTLLNTTVNVDGRNLIGKALKDQTLNENTYTGYKEIDSIIGDMLKNANLLKTQFKIQPNAEKRRYEFEPNKEVISGLEEILKSLVNWKMEETTEGEIIIGSPSYSGFPQRGKYTFYRNKDIFSRQITRDDQGSYRKVCVHDRDFNIKIYKDVDVFGGWNLQSNKTLFVLVADGTSNANAQAIANEVANRLGNVGKIESFTGSIKPHLLVGDEAWIVDEDGTTNLGLITEISHDVGKQGFTTSFTVDSGGRLGRGRLSDYINMIKTRGTVGSIGYEDIIPEPEIPTEP